MWLRLYTIFVWLSDISVGILVLTLVYKGALGVSKKARLPKVLRIEIPWRVVRALAGGLALLLVFRAATRFLSDRQLHARTAQLSTELIGFANEKIAGMPPEGQPNWDEYTRTVGALADECRAEYARRFRERVRSAEEELRRRGLADRGIDRLVRDPSTPLVIRAIGERLELLSNQLPKW